MNLNSIYCGNALDVPKTFPNESIDMCITSPPYFGLRDYGTEPYIWDADPNCQHEWQTNKFKQHSGRGDCQKSGKYSEQESIPDKELEYRFCTKCNAWCGNLGQEPTVELYIKHLCDIYDEVHRVLKKTGTCWVNLGDTYGGSGGNHKSHHKNNTGFQGKGAELRGRRGNKLVAKSLCQIPSRFAIEMCNRGWILRNEIIWFKPNCLGGGTVLYARTQKGVVLSTIKDLVRLNPKTVKLWDGKKWQQVKKWIKNDNPQNIKTITFRNGEVITCTGDHIFPLKNKKLITANNINIGHIINHTSLPAETKIAKYIPDDIGWLLGTYLADGSLGNNGRCIQISSHSKELIRFKRLKQIASDYDSNWYMYNEPSNFTTFNIYSKVLISIIKKYVVGNTAKNKHLTSAVWQRNNNFINNLLIGYLDGDGHFDKPNNRYRLMFTRNKYLACDLRTICARLNCHIKLKNKFATFKNKLFPIYRGEIKFSVSKHRNIKSDYEVINIKQGKKIGNFWDIVLEKSPHLFASHSGILIHNCMPSSTKDRFTVDFEKLFFFTKSSEPQFWTNKKTKLLITTKPLGIKGVENIDWEWKTTTKVVDGIDTIFTKKSTLWESHDYYFETQYEPVQQCSIDGLNRAISNKQKYTDGAPGQTKQTINQLRPKGSNHFDPVKGRIKRCVWKISTKSYKGAHFATYSPELIKSPIKAGCPEFICNKCKKPRVKIYKKVGEIQRRGSKNNADNSPYNKQSSMQNVTEEVSYTDCGCDAGFSAGIVLDPFIGSGTTAVVAKKLNRQYIGIELNQDYINLINKRIKENK